MNEKKRQIIESMAAPLIEEYRERLTLSKQWPMCENLADTLHNIESHAFRNGASGQKERLQWFQALILRDMLTMRASMGAVVYVEGPEDGVAGRIVNWLWKYQPFEICIRPYVEGMVQKITVDWSDEHTVAML